MDNAQIGVMRFHQTYGQPVGHVPHALDKDRIDLRVGLIREEFEEELIPALEAGDILETYDACLDIIYVTHGILVEMGLDAEPGMEEVQRSNMSKLGEDGQPIRSRGIELDGFREGKVLKGPNYFKPDLKKIIDAQIADGRHLIPRAAAYYEENHTPKVAYLGLATTQQLLDELAYRLSEAQRNGSGRLEYVEIHEDERDV